MEINLRIDEITKHGFLGASLLVIMRRTNFKTAEKMAGILTFSNIRAIENELTALHNRRAIIYERTKDNTKMAFLIKG